MKVLQRGIWESERTCLSCSSTLLIEQEDICYSIEMAETMARTTPFYFVCQVCRLSNPLDRLPAHIVQSIINGYEKVK